MDPLFLRLRRLLGALLLGLLALAGGGAAAQGLVLDGRVSIAVWPAVTVLPDDAQALGVEQVLARQSDFMVPTGTRGNLGRAHSTVWLRIPVLVPGGQPLQRVLEIDYPSLNRVDLYVLSEGRVAQHARMGNELPLHERALPSRAHAATLELAPGPNVLLLRVQSLSSLVLPISIHTPASFAAAEAREALIQGVTLGIVLCMMLYSLAHGFSLRDQAFIDYALLLGGNTAFMLCYYGIGPQMLWPDWPALSLPLAPWGLLVAVFAGTRFMRTTLAVHEVSRNADRLLFATGWVALAGLATSALGWIDYRATQSLVSVLGVVSMLVVLPVAYARARRGERVASYILFGWACYMVGALTAAALLRGLLEPTAWAQHLYPLSMMVEMAAWMSVLGLRVKSIHSSADRVRIESEALRALAHTDALTGLPNRRGLQRILEPALRQCQPDRLVAVYLLDLDGFKPVNDRFGHDVGDALLVAVGQRLQQQLRQHDIVARLGGDEFVVVAANLGDESAACNLGDKLLLACARPFEAAGQVCTVGLTIGYALAPLDTSDGEELLKRADAAMYAGKKAGRGQVQRGGRRLVTA